MESSKKMKKIGWILSHLPAGISLSQQSDHSFVDGQLVDLSVKSLMIMSPKCLSLVWEASCVTRSQTWKRVRHLMPLELKQENKQKACY
jgi:hypothetical protein